MSSPNQTPTGELVLRARELNATLGEAAPAVHEALSPLGLASYYPRDIPFQAAEASGARFNATIGQITDGHGKILSLSSIRSTLDLEAQSLNKALLYSPIAGHPALRDAWNRYQTPADCLGTGGELPCGPPLVTVGLTHAIALVADLFAGPGTDVVIPDPCWGNYVQIFGLRHGARIHRAPSYRDGHWSWHGLKTCLSELEGNRPAVVVLNLPSNPGGYSPTDAERSELKEILLAAAGKRVLTVLCDDAYAGLVFDEAISSRSMFWDLLGLHDRLIPIRGSGSTKEFLLFGGRVGFLTVPFAARHQAFEVLEDKLCALVRSSVGSPVSVSQIMLSEALTQRSAQGEMAEVRAVLRRRFEVMKRSLESCGSDDFRVLPCNSGAFMLLELRAGLDPEAIRKLLLREYETGVVSIAPKYLRLAFCSVAEEAIPGLVQRVVDCVRAVAS